MPKLNKLEPEPRLQGESSRVIEWARRATNVLNPLADTLLSAFATVSSTISTLKIKSDTGSAELAVDKAAGTFTAALTGYRAGLPRWQIELGNTTAEPGANAGSDFSLNAYADGGGYLFSPIQIVRSSGLTIVNKGLTITAGGFSVTGAATFNTATTFNAGATANVFYTHPGNGIQLSPSNQYDGSSSYYCMGLIGDPAYSGANQTFHCLRHYVGVWAGHQFIVGNTQEYRLRHDGWGESPAGWRTLSDARLKTNLVKIVDATAKVAALTGYEFDRVDLNNIDGTPVHQVGLIAQDAQAVLPASVHQDKATEQDSDPKRSLNYDAIVALLVNAFNEQAAQVAALRAEIQTLKGAANG